MHSVSLTEIKRRIRDKVLFFFSSLSSTVTVDYGLCCFTLHTSCRKTKVVIYDDTTWPLFLKKTFQGMEPMIV